MKTPYKLHPLLEDLPLNERACDVCGCKHQGVYRAPKSPSQLNDYYWFCLEHVQEYNLKWDYYKRMSSEEIERAYREDAGWQRPTWKFGHNRGSFKHSDISDPFDFFIKQRKAQTEYKRPEFFSPYSEEGQALKVLSLSLPLDQATLKKKYKELAKKYHPDLNPGCEQSQEFLKAINQAYSVLKKII